MKFIDVSNQKHPAASNETIGYWDGYVIIQNGWGKLFVVERPEEFFYPVESIETQYLIPISKLPAEKQQGIQDYMKKWEEG